MTISKEQFERNEEAVDFLNKEIVAALIRTNQILEFLRKKRPMPVICIIL